MPFRLEVLHRVHLVDVVPERGRPNPAGSVVHVPASRVNEDKGEHDEVAAVDQAGCVVSRGPEIGAKSRTPWRPFISNGSRQ